MKISILTNVTKKLGRGGLLVVLGCIVLPILCIRLSDENEWVGRLVGVFIAFGVGVPACFWYSLNPRIKYIKDSAKLHKYPKAIPFVVIFFRLLFLTCGLVLGIGIFRPLVLDTIDVLGGTKPQTSTGTVALARAPFPLLEVFSQELQVTANGTISTYRFYYPLRPRINRGATCNFVFLPRSKVILELMELKKDDL